MQSLTFSYFWGPRWGPKGKIQETFKKTKLFYFMRTTFCTYNTFPKSFSKRVKTSSQNMPPRRSRERMWKTCSTKILPNTQNDLEFISKHLLYKQVQKVQYSTQWVITFFPSLKNSVLKENSLCRLSRSTQVAS